MPTMLVRRAALTDLSACLALDANSQTDHVWQMDEREDANGILVRFRLVRLPRVMRVTYPRPRNDLVACWKEGATVLVATDNPGTEADEETEPARVFGYCQLDVLPWQQAGWISHLIVERRLRRRGIGTALLKAAIAWGREQGLRRLMCAVQTKNYPAIAFCEKHGFTFCGFNEHYFANRDIALFFTLQIRA